MSNLYMMIKRYNTIAMLLNIDKLINIIGGNKSGKISVVIIILVGARVFVYTGLCLNERIAVRTAIPHSRIARWPVIIRVAVVY